MAKAVGIKIEVIGSESVDDLNAKIKAATAAWKGLSDIDRQLNAELGKTIAHMKDLKAKAMDPLMGANAKMKQSYFELGTQLRSANVAALSLGNTIQDASYGFLNFRQGIIAVSNNIPLLINQMASLKLEGRAAGMTLGQTFSAMLRGPGGVFVVISAVSALSVALSTLIGKTEKTADVAQNLRKEYERIVDLMLQLKGMQAVGAREERSVQLEEANELLARQQVLQQSRPSAKGTGFSIPVFNIGNIFDKPGLLEFVGKEIKPLTEEEKKKDAEITEEVAKNNIRLAKLVKEIADKIESDLLIARQASIMGRSKTAFTEAVREGRGIDQPTRIIPPRIELEQKQPGESNAEFARRVPGIGKAVAEMVEEATAEAARNAEKLKQTLVGGARTFASTLINALVEGNNLARSLALSLLEAFIQLGIGYFTAGVSEAFTPVAKAVIKDSGRGGSDYSPAIIAERAASFAGGGEPYVTVVPIVDNAGLAVRVEVGDRINRRRRLV
jgi:hypothetical protein